MDIKMPVMDGLAAARRLRAEGCRLPILALTANADPWDAADYMEAGMDGVVEKPIRPEALLAAMTAATAVPVRDGGAEGLASAV
jgi:CheY-like chemotaxis protein